MIRVPLFSVIVPTFDRPALLRMAVESVLHQSLPDFEIIVVDDGGTKPIEVPAEPRIRVVRRDHRGGPAAARNTGIAHARGRFICFLDDDDLYTFHRLEVVAQHLDRTPLVLVWARYLEGQAKPGRRLEGNVHDVILDATTPTLGTVTIRRDVIVPFDETYFAAEDLEWWLRQSRACPVTTVPSFSYLVRRHSGAREGWGTSARIENQLRLLRQHEAYFQDHPRARAFRWRRIGLMRLALGDSSGARAAFTTSFAARPSARTAWHFLRSLWMGREEIPGVPTGHGTGRAASSPGGRAS